MVSSMACPSQIYALVLTASFRAWFVFELWVFVRERKSARDGSRDRGSTLLLVFLLSAGIALGLNLPEIEPQFDIRGFLTGFFALGIALVIAGLLFRLWAVQTLGRCFHTQAVSWRLRHSSARSSRTSSRGRDP